MDARKDRKARTENTEPRDEAAAIRAARFGKLPQRVALADMVEERPAEAPNDPEFGRNPENDWMIRYSA